jgi:hypothetical protein
MCGNMKILQENTSTLKMTSIVKSSTFLISLKLIILITNEALKLMQSKQDCDLIIPMYIINIFMDLLV